jgi:hypothetical protein
MHILYIAGNPIFEKGLRIEDELNALQSELDDSPAPDPIELRVYSAIRVDQVASVISKAAPDVIHFSAHGTKNAIVLADRDDRSVELTGDRLAALFESIGVRPTLVVVNACDSVEMARSLSRAAEFVIGTDAPIGNDAARVMAATLYQRLARGSTLYASFEAARQMLGTVSNGKVSTKLFPEGSEAAARRRVLFEPFRIVARLPELDSALEEKLTKLKRGFDEEYPVVNFGVAGAPVSSTQLVLFTDDESIVPGEGGSMEEIRSWIMPNRAVRGEIWTKPAYRYFGDMDWYAAVVTGDQRIVCSASTTRAALTRYYLEEQWRGELPEAMRQLVERVIANLTTRDGALRDPNNRNHRG